ncbi:helicase-related protein, partial [Deferrisoma sp.]
MPPTGRLPVDDLAPRFAEALAAGLVVVSAPTGTGKSTQVPRWAAARGRVLVVEPRRVACRALAARVAELEGERLGEGVGYVVRAERKATPATRIVFATPGVVLRWLAAGPLADFATVVLDEFHERSLDLDLLLALLLERGRHRLVVMSATLEAERVARHLGAAVLRAEGRRFPVEIRHVPGRAFLPEVRGLEDRILEALGRAADDPGDVLVFLPGKAEIAAAAARLAGRRDLEILPLHGGLSLEEQSRVFSRPAKRRVVLATNVAETSLTIPGIGVVIDSGLVRRTRYHNGRGFLTLLPVARDSAEQRAGRAGRTAPGVCYRLWSPEAILTETTPPEIHREALEPLVLAAAACGARVEDLPFLDPPKPYAVAAARESLGRLGALDPAGRITQRGRRLFGLPLDAPLGAILVEAERLGCLEDAVDLVAALAVGRPLFRGPPRGDPLREEGCDAVALVRAVREARPDRDRVHGPVLAEARAVRRELRAAMGLEGAGPRAGGPADRKALALAVLRADPRAAHVARRRKKFTAWANGEAEAALAEGSAVDSGEHRCLAALEVRAVGTGYRKTRLVISAAMPVPPAWLVEAGIGEQRPGRVRVADDRLVCETEICHAGEVLARREEVPAGRLAREAATRAVADGQAFSGVWDELVRRLADRDRLQRLAGAGLVPASLAALVPDTRPDPPERWLLGRLEELGFESGEDL